jgi:cytochrome c-type biogenesis protein CcmH
MFSALLTRSRKCGAVPPDRAGSPGPAFPTSRTARLMLAVFCLLLGAVPHSTSQDNAALEREVGDKLACLCGSCKNTVATCPMLRCHYGEPAKAKIKAMVAEGKSADVIIASFVEEHGKQALAEPPREGFDLMAFVMPALAVAFGLGLVLIVIRRLSKPGAVPVKRTDSKALSRYQEQIDRDLAQMD